MELVGPHFDASDFDVMEAIIARYWETHHKADWLGVGVFVER